MRQAHSTSYPSAKAHPTTGTNAQENSIRTITGQPLSLVSSAQAWERYLVSLMVSQHRPNDTATCPEGRAPKRPTPRHG